jgi:putative ABC transport system permease protein
MLRRRAGFTLITVLLLALGIGANTALFSVVYTVFLKPLPYPDSEQLVTVFEANTSKSSKDSLIAPVRLQDWHRLNRTFQAIAGYYSDNVTDTTGAAPERLAARRVSPRYFEVYGTPPVIGRTFSADEEKPGGPLAVVLSHGLWVRRYGSDPRAVGSRVTLGGSAYTVVGVMPRNFDRGPVDLWIATPLNPYLAQARNARFYGGIGRMRPGVTLPQAQEDLGRVQRELGQEFPATDKDWSAVIYGMKESVIGDKGQSAVLMLAAVALLMLLACANIAGLLLGHLRERARELAIRASLGASRFAIVATVMREVAVIAVLGGMLGLILSVWGLDLASTALASLPRIQELRFDWRVVLFNVAISMTAAGVIGLFPAVSATRTRLAGSLTSRSRTRTGGERRFQSALVVTQFAVTMVLLIGAGLLLRTYQQLTRVDTGFVSEGVLTFHVAAEWGEDRDAIGRLQQNILAELQRLPQIEAAGITNFLPASGATLRYQVAVDGLSGEDTSGSYTAGARMVSAGYLQALRVPMLAGEACPSFNLPAKQQPKALVNRSFVERVARGENLLGKRLRVLGTDVRSAPEIAGVIGDVREDELRSPGVPYVYMCAAAGGWPDPNYVVRFRGDARQASAAVRQVIQTLAPNRAIFAMKTLDEFVDMQLAQPRVTARVLLAFALAALLLAAVGLYATMNMAVSTRTREIGVRMALGARPAQVLGHVLAQAGTLVGSGVVLGATLSFAATTLLRSMLFGVQPGDPLTAAAVVGLLTAVCLAAVLVPCRRAAKVDPVEALRME